MNLIDQLDKFYSEQKITVIRDDLRFCHKLGIGEKAYASLRQRENLRNMVEALSLGAVASGAMASSVVAGSLFSGSGLLATMGLATAVTPVGWVIGAGLAVGGGYLGLVKMLEQPKDKGVVVIPKHINTPLDLLASTLLDFFLPLGLKFSWLDNHVCVKEQEAMQNYLTEEWGYSEAFLEKQLPLFSSFAKQVDITDVVTRYIDFTKGNPDCDLSSMHKYTMSYLNAIVSADGHVSEEEQSALDAVDSLFINASDTAKLKSSVVVAKNTLVKTASNSGSVFIGTSKGFASKAAELGTNAFSTAKYMSAKGMQQAKETGDKAVKATSEMKNKGTEGAKALLSMVKGKAKQTSNQ